MRPTRRGLLKAGALSGIVLFAGPAFGSGDEPPTEPSSPAAERTERAITRALLQPHVGQTFQVEIRGGGGIQLTLSQVGDLPSAKAAGTVGSNESFAAEFTSTSGNMLSQGTYELRHATLGTLTIFLVPVNRPSPISTYEAIFNRQKK